MSFKAQNAGYSLIEIVDYLGSLGIITIAVSGFADAKTSIIMAVTGLFTFLLTIISTRIRQSTIENLLRALTALQQQTEIIQFQILFACQFYDTVITGQDGFPTILQTMTNPPSNVVNNRIIESNALAIKLDTAIKKFQSELPESTPDIIIEVVDIIVKESEKVVTAFQTSNAIANSNVWYVNPSDDNLRSILLNSVALYLIPAHELCGSVQILGFTLDAIINQITVNL